MSSSTDHSNLTPLEEAAEGWAHNSTLLLIDGQHTAYRAFHTRDLSTMDGKHTSVLHGVLEMVQGMCEAANTQRFLVVWDGSDSLNWRRSMWPQYKNRHDRERTPDEVQAMKDRQESIRNAKEGLDELGIPQLEVKQSECDDLIGVLATMGAKLIAVQREKGKSDLERVVVVSDDKDFMQLLTPDVMQWRGIASKLVTVESFTESHGFGPELFVDYKALVGEPASGDNIPGVKGIGDQTATKLIQMHGDLDHIILAAKDKVKLAGKKPSKRDQSLVLEEDTARLSKRLSRITRMHSEIPADFIDHAQLRDATAGAMKAALMVPRSVSLEQIVDFRGRWEFGSLESKRFCKTLGYVMNEG